MEKINKFFNSEKSYLFTSSDFIPGQFCCALYEEDKRWWLTVFSTTFNRVIIVKIVVLNRDYRKNHTFFSITFDRVIIVKIVVRFLSLD